MVGRGRAGIKNGDLLRRMSGDYDVLITMDRGIEFQQSIAGFPFGVVIAHAASNRLQQLRTSGSGDPRAIASITPGQVQRVGA